MTPSWIYLTAAGMLEIGWALSLKQSEAFSRLTWSLATFVLMIGSFYLLALALRDIPIGTAYAVWTGIGAVGVAIIGMVFLAEPTTLMRIGCLAMIIAGIIGLKVSNI